MIIDFKCMHCAKPTRYERSDGFQGPVRKTCDSCQINAKRAAAKRTYYRAKDRRKAAAQSSDLLTINDRAASPQKSECVAQPTDHDHRVVDLDAYRNETVDLNPGKVRFIPPEPATRYSSKTIFCAPTSASSFMIAEMDMATSTIRHLDNKPTMVEAEAFAAGYRMAQREAEATAVRA